MDSNPRCTSRPPAPPNRFTPPSHPRRADRGQTRAHAWMPSASSNEAPFGAELDWRSPELVGGIRRGRASARSPSQHGRPHHHPADDSDRITPPTDTPSERRNLPSDPRPAPHPQRTFRSLGPVGESGESGTGLRLLLLFLATCDPARLTFLSRPPTRGGTHLVRATFPCGRHLPSGPQPPPQRTLTLRLSHPGSGTPPAPSRCRSEPPKPSARPTAPSHPAGKADSARWAPRAEPLPESRTQTPQTSPSHPSHSPSPQTSIHSSLATALGIRAIGTTPTPSPHNQPQHPLAKAPHRPLRSRVRPIPHHP